MNSWCVGISISLTLPWLFGDERALAAAYLGTERRGMRPARMPCHSPCAKILRGPSTGKIGPFVRKSAKARIFGLLPPADAISLTSIGNSRLSKVENLELG